VQLTDQATVAVLLARSFGGRGDSPGSRGANVAHLVAGLAGEPEGHAGHLLVANFGDVAPRIVSHPSTTARALPALDTAFVALPIMPRPCWSVELLQAARRVGGRDLEALLVDCGVSLELLDLQDGPELSDPARVEEEVTRPETFGRMDLLRRGFTQDADLAVARTRATGGDSRDLLRWLQADDATMAALAKAPTVDIDSVVSRAGLNDMSVGSAELITAITHLSLRQALRGQGVQRQGPG
jgi:hypothetical protein